MDYIYSYLNDDVASREMHGSETNTAVVTVNAATNTISVDVKPISPSMLNVTKPTETGSYILQETISALGEVSYSWATLEDYNQEVTQAIASLTQQLEQEKQERIESVQDEANTRELADTQLRTEFTSEIAQEKQEREQAVSEEAQRTNSMINQLNDNVQEGFNTINNVLTTSINNINNAILNESTVREEQYQDTEFRIRDLNTRLGVEIDNRESWDAEIYANLSADIANEKRERVEQDQDIRNSISAEANLRQEAFDELSNKISSEANRTDNMINQLNNNVQEGFNILNTVLIDSINTINGGIEEERQTRATADETLQSNIDAEANERKSVDQHLWDILPDNIVAGTPMQGMENANAINIVFSKYQKHGIGEDPSDAELVEVPNQAITLFPATQEVAGVLTAADKTKIDNIATDIETAVQAEANARKEADNALSERITAIEDTNVLQSQILGDGRIQTTINSPAGRTFDVDVVDISNASNDDRFTVTLNNNDSISAMLTDGTTSVPLVFMSKWNKVEVGGSGAPLNLNSDDGTVTVNDEHTLLNETDKEELSTAIDTETERATDAEASLQQAVDSEKNRAEAAETNINTSISDVVQKATHNVIDSVAINIVSGNSASLDYTTYNPGIGTAGESSSTPIPMANSTTAGLMSSTHVNNIDNSVKKNGVAEQTVNGVLNVSGNVTIGGNLHVQGNTVTVDTETLNVADNLIVTNSDGTELEYPSGIAIKTTATSAFGIVYAPDDDELKAGIGTVDENNEFLFNPDEGNPITLRDSDKKLTDGNILVWTNAGHKLIDSDIPATQIARKDKAQTFNGVQTFVNAIEVPSINVNGVQLTSNVAGNIAVESQIADAVNSLVNGANAGYQNFGEVEITVSAINTDLQEYKTSTNQNITQLENDLASEGKRITQAENNISGINSNIANHVANVNNPHNVTKEQIGLSKVADVLQYSEENEPPYPVTSVAGRFGNITLTKSDVGLDNVPNVNTANASNINSGTLSRNIIEDGLIVAGANISVNRNSENGAYTISATTGGVVPVVSVAGKSGPEVTLNSITFNGAYNATYNGSSDIKVTIPNVPSLHSVSLSTNNGSASTVIGNVYSNSATPIEISIVRGTPTGNGAAVVDIQVSTVGNVVTITPVLGPVNDGTL